MYRWIEMGTVYRVSEDDKQELREPRGDVVEGEGLLHTVEDREFHRLIAVGDRVSIDLIEGGIEPDISVVDGKIQRSETGEEERRVLEDLSPDLELGVEDPAGEITERGWRTVREAIARDCTSVVRVDGEEDLLALPAITYASPDSLVVYGQRGEGAVVLEPDRRMKQFVRDLVGRERYGKVIVGGTWEHLHAGHRSLLLEAFARGSTVDVGITSDQYLRQKLEGDGFQDFRERKEVLERFLQNFGLQERAEILEIEGFRGNAVEEGDALVVTEETLESGERINELRGERGREPLELLEVEMVRDAGDSPIGSSRIRDGEIDRNGLPDP
ncbi:MAG: pantetheine-phosphate adenylyltransferase [Candidatus Nanohaloarchaea archaeon]